MRLESGQYRIAENLIRTKHVVAAGWLAWDAGSIPAASTIFYWCFLIVINRTGQGRFTISMKNDLSKSKSPKTRQPFDVIKEGSILIPIYAHTNIIPHRHPRRVLFSTRTCGKGSSRPELNTKAKSTPSSTTRARSACAGSFPIWRRHGTKRKRPPSNSPMVNRSP